jgi:hypothetical protein
MLNKIIERYIIIAVCGICVLFAPYLAFANGSISGNDLVTVRGIVKGHHWGPDRPQFLILTLPDGKEVEILYEDLAVLEPIENRCDSNNKMWNVAANLKPGTKITVHGRYKVRIFGNKTEKWLAVCTAPDESITTDQN